MRKSKWTISINFQHEEDGKPERMASISESDSWEDDGHQIPELCCLALTMGGILAGIEGMSVTVPCLSKKDMVDSFVDGLNAEDLLQVTES